MAIKRNSFFYKIVINLGIAVASVILYYFLFSPFLDTPVEYELKKTNKQLNTEYNKMLAVYDIVDSVRNNLSDRDKDVYKRLFNTLPTSFSEQYFEDRGANDSLYQNGSVNELIDAFNSRIDEFERAVNNGKDEIIELEKEIVKMGHKFDNIPSIQPVENQKFTKNIVSSGMKLNPFYKMPALHKGMDYAVEEGTRVFATADGVVSKTAASGDGKGIYIEVDHQNGYKTIYANLSKTVVVKNETVDKGDIIGYSGNSGYSFLPHLHYEVLYRGENRDPLYFIFKELSLLQNYYIESIASQTIQSFD